MFRAQMPEFNNVSDVLVTAMLGAAALEIDPSVWGPLGVVGGLMTKADQGQLYLAAFKLAASPFGQNAKGEFRSQHNSRGPSVTGYQTNSYGQQFLLLQRGVTSGFRVA